MDKHEALEGIHLRSKNSSAIFLVVDRKTLSLILQSGNKGRDVYLGFCPKSVSENSLWKKLKAETPVFITAKVSS